MYSTYTNIQNIQYVYTPMTAGEQSELHLIQVSKTGKVAFTFYYSHFKKTKNAMLKDTETKQNR